MCQSPTQSNSTRKLFKPAMGASKQVMRKQVRFNEMSEMFLVDDLRLSEYKNELWFTKQELGDIKQATRRLIFHVVTRAEAHGSQASHVLGFEKFLSPDLMHEYKIRRQTLFHEVLSEAHCQFLPSSMNERSKVIVQLHHADKLARLSEMHSKWARCKARLSALVLELDQENATASAKVIGRRVKSLHAMIEHA